MKILGLLIFISIVIIGYCVYNPMIVDSADFPDAQKGKSSSSDCKGPFGIDSQKILDENQRKYEIGIVSEIDHAKKADGTWYVGRLDLSDPQMTIRLGSPHPQQNDFKEGDCVGYIIKREYGISWYEKLENISSQSVDCKVENIGKLSTPSKSEEDLGDVTGLVMAVVIRKNYNPEPDNPDDFQIRKVVMKCADDNLYVVDLLSKSRFEYYENRRLYLDYQKKQREKYRGINWCKSSES